MLMIFVLNAITERDLIPMIYVGNGLFTKVGHKIN